MSERINLGKSAPALYQAVMGLEKLAAEAIASASIPAGFLHICCAFVHPNSTSAHSASGCILMTPYPVESRAIA